MTSLNYENRYGSLEVEVLESYREVSGILSKDVAEHLFFSVDDAEKIALITGNNDVQICFAAYNRSKAFLIHHKEASLAAVCRVSNLNYTSGKNPAKELENPTLMTYIGGCI
jgi:hypothetical protein